MAAPAAAITGWIIEASGWRRRLIALAAGATGALAMAPVDFWPALAVPMTAAVWLIDGADDRSAKKSPAASWAGQRDWRVWPSARWAAWRRSPPARALAAGWWWGFGYFLAGLWWLGAAFLADGGAYALAMPLGVVGLPAAMALYPAVGFMLARLVWTPGPARIFAFAAALTLTEWLRGTLFTGFPWNAFGMALGGNLVAAQFASITGLYGLTLAAILIFAAPATLVSRTAARSAFVPSAAAFVGLAAIFAFGGFRLAHAKNGDIPNVALKIMQPNLAQGDKFRPEYKEQILAGYLALSDLAADAQSTDLTVVIWPESPFPFILSRDAGAMAEIAAALPLGAILVTGAARVEEDGRIPASGLELPELSFANPVFFNAILVIASNGVIVDTYDKAHLVPFGEYLPFESALSRVGLHHFVHVPGGFTAGAARKTLNVPGLPPVAPLICYEAIFPGEALPQERGAPRPGLLLNVTDDGWFGLTAGPHQHFAQARLRAIEEGLPLVRAANTGISAIVDPYGRIRESLPLGVAGLLRGALPRAIAPPPFARSPVSLALVAWLAVAAAAVTSRAKRGAHKSLV